VLPSEPWNRVAKDLCRKLERDDDHGHHHGKRDDDDDD
jgi:hypothetical protein